MSFTSGSCPASPAAGASDAEWQQSQTAKHFLQAAESGNAAAVSRLLRRGVDVNTRDEGEWSERYMAGYTPGRPALIRAAQQGHIEVVRVLLAAGADTELRDDDYWTALHWAANNGHSAVVRQLLEAGAACDPKDHERRTPLIYASIRGCADAVAALLAAGAAPAEVDRFDKRALTLSLEHSNSDVARLLEQAEREASRAGGGMSPRRAASLRRERDAAVARCAELEAEVAALRRRLETAGLAADGAAGGGGEGGG